MFVHIHIFFFSWRAPKLSKAQEREWGERFLMLGTDHFLWQFRKWVGNNPMTPPLPNSVLGLLDLETGPPRPRLDNFLSVTQAVIGPVEYWILGGYILVCIGSAIYVGDHRIFWLMLACGLVFWGLWVGSLLFGFYRYRRWIDRLSRAD
jgi:hypothetical protein